MRRSLNDRSGRGPAVRYGYPSAGWRVLLALTLLLALAATLRVPSAGAALQVRIAAQANFGGNYRPGEWVPVTVGLANDGATVTGDGVLEAQVSGDTVRYSQRIELPTRSQKVLTLYARVAGSGSLAVSFAAGKDRADAPPIAVQPSRSSQQLVGVVADDALVGEEVRRALIGAYGTGRIEVAVFPPDEIPGNTYGLNSFAGLIVGDATTGRWSAEQRAALSAWVARGGKLVVGGGPNARKAVEGLGELPPLRPRGSVTASGLTGFGSGAPGGQWVLATGDLIPEANHQRDQEGLPLVAGRTWGRGTVTSLAFDPATSGFTAWSGAGSFWTGLGLDVGLPASLQSPFSQNGSASYTGTSQSYQIANVLRDLPGLSLPPTWAVGLVLLLFIILIGPVNYLVLRRLDRRELAWVTIPALTIVFALGIYAFGATTKGRSITVNSVSIVRIAPDARAAEVQAFYGIFTPSRGTRDFGVATDALFTGFSQNGLGDPGELGGDVRFEQGTSGGVRAASFAQWTQRSVAAQGTVDPAPLVLRAELSWQGSKLVGTVTNTSNQALEDALLVYSNAYFNVGNLAPGASRAVDWLPVSAGGTTGYRSGLGTAFYAGTTGSPYSNSRQAGNLGVTGRRAEVLDSLSGAVLAYGGRAGPSTNPYSPTATATPRPTPPPGGTGATGATRSGGGSVQLLFWRPDTPLELRINAGERNATTLVIQELQPGTATQRGPAPLAAVGGAR